MISIAFKYDHWRLILSVLGTFVFEHGIPEPNSPADDEAFEKIRPLMLEGLSAMFVASGGGEDVHRINSKIAQCLGIIQGCVERKQPFLTRFD
jgi:hypothetical protein